MNKQNQEWMRTMNGKELWTNAFGERFYERVCVGFKDLQCVKDGEWFTPTDKEVKALRDDQLISEYGTTDMKAILRMEGF